MVLPGGFRFFCLITKYNKKSHPQVKSNTIGLILAEEQ